MEKGDNSAQRNTRKRSEGKKKKKGGTNFMVKNE